MTPEIPTNTLLIDVARLRADIPTLHLTYRYLGQEDLTLLRFVLMGVPGHLTPQAIRANPEALGDHLEALWIATNTTSLRFDTYVDDRQYLDIRNCYVEHTRLVTALIHWLDLHIGPLAETDRVVGIKRVWINYKDLSHVDAFIEPDYYAAELAHANP